MAREEDINEEEFSEGSIYDEDGREDLVADDEMSAEEEGFMKGYDAANEKEDEVDEEDNEDEEEV